jgi:hypothetical protein
MPGDRARLCVWPLHHWLTRHFVRARAHATQRNTRSTAAQLIRAASGPYRPPQLPHVRQLAVIGTDEDELDVWTTPAASPGPFSLRWIGFRQLMS